MEEKTATESGVAENVAENKKKSIDTGRILKCTDMAILTLVQALTVIFYFTGSAYVFGEKISLLKCFYIFGDLFNYNAVNGFRLIVSALLAILYVAFAVVMIIKLIQTIKFTFLFKNNSRTDTILSIKENGTFILILSFIFIIVSNGFYGNQISSTATASLCLTGIALTFHEGVFCYVKTNKFTLSESVYKCIKFLLGFAAVAIALVMLNKAVIMDFVNGCKMLFKGILFSDVYVFMIKLFNNFVMPVLYFIAAIWILKACDYNLSSYYVNRNDSRTLVKKSWILSIVILSLQFIFNGLILSKFQQISISIITTWWYSVKSVYFPIFLLLTAWFLVMKFTPKEISDI